MDSLAGNLFLGFIPTHSRPIEPAYRNQGIAHSTQRRDLPNVRLVVPLAALPQQPRPRVTPGEGLRIAEAAPGEVLQPLLSPQTPSPKRKMKPNMEIPEIQRFPDSMSKVEGMLPLWFWGPYFHYFGPLFCYLPLRDDVERTSANFFPVKVEDAQGGCAHIQLMLLNTSKIADARPTFPHETSLQREKVMFTTKEGEKRDAALDPPPPTQTGTCLFRTAQKGKSAEKGEVYLKKGGVYQKKGKSTKKGGSLPHNTMDLFTKQLTTEETVEVYQTLRPNLGETSAAWRRKARGGGAPQSAASAAATALGSAAPASREANHGQSWRAGGRRGGGGGGRRGKGGRGGGRGRHRKWGGVEWGWREGGRVWSHRNLDVFLNTHGTIMVES